MPDISSDDALSFVPREFIAQINADLLTMNTELQT